MATAAATYVGAAGPPRGLEKGPYPFFPVASADHRAQTPDASPLAAHQQLLNRYCITCHNQRAKTAGLALDALSLSNVAADAPTWEKVVVKLRAGFMPPVGRPRPDAAAYEAFASWLERELDRAAAANPNPGWNPLFHRLNRAEYQNVVRDLMAVQVDVGSLLPPDDASYGFDNMAGVLRMSPTLMERYLSAAQKVGRLAIGTPVQTPDAELYRIPDDLPQEQHLDGLPFGTRGGTLIQHAFPVDGEYSIKVRLARDFEDYVPVWPDDQQLEVSVDGRRVQLFTVPGEAVHEAEPDEFQPTRAKRDATPPPTASAGQRPARDRQQIRLEAEQRAQRQQARKRIDADWQVRVPVTAGTHEVVVAFVEKTNALAETVKAPFERPYAGGFNYIETRMQAYLRTVEISGPFDGGAVGESDSRRRIFVCRPRRPSDEGGCAKTILSTLARRAYRRSISNADLDVLQKFYKIGRAGGTFDDGIELALERVLVSPEFLFRIEKDPTVAPSRTGAPTSAAVSRISDVELASRLSFFLWSSMPDDELLNLAAKDQLREPTVLEHQVRRMLADRRSIVARQQLRGAVAVSAKSARRGARPSSSSRFRRESAAGDSAARPSSSSRIIVREDRSVLELLTADYTFVNERLARHYGIPNVSGARFRRVTLQSDEPARAARPGQHPHGDLVSAADVAGAARQMDSREPSRRAAADAAAERSGPAADECPRASAVDARADGAASGQSGVRELSRADGSARLRARELRRGRQVRGRSIRSSRRLTRQACCRTARRFDGPAGSAQGAAEPLGALHHDGDGEAAHVRARPRRRVVRRAGRPRDRARRRAGRLSVLVSGPRHRQECAVSDAETAAMIITKMALPRRTFLRGVGATLALPLLDAMVPALSAMRQDCGAARASARILLPAERRGDERHRHQLLEAGRRGDGIRAVADPGAARAVSATRWW